MKRYLSIVVVFGLVCSLGVAADDLVMGDWEGKIGEQVVSAKVVADGEGKYHAILLLPEKKEVTLLGETKDDTAAFARKGGECKGEIKDGAFTGACKAGEFSMSRVEKKSPTLGAKPPEGAIVLFDGTNMDEWTHAEDHPPEWKLVDGAMEVVSGSWPAKNDPKKKVHKNLFSKRTFKNFHMHLEFCCPFMPTKRDQGRGNSGVYLPDGSEIQVLDSFGKPPAWNECGGIYKQAVPLVDAELPPGEWQTYDVDFTAPVFENGKRVKGAIITVQHNGQMIHDRFEADKNRPEGAIMLQDHGNPVRYRNIWIVPKE